MNEPFLLTPAYKDYLWGGNRLKTEFNKVTAIEPLAESWECSTHSAGLSVAASGKFKGMTLRNILKENPDYIGEHPKELLSKEALERGELPIMIKLIDANKDLSVQVHPDDKYAAEHENGELGKIEMWYVVDASKDASLIYGLNHNIDSKILAAAIKNKTIENYLQRIKIKKDDIFFVEPGTIHAIGKGALIAEVQESSNLTYRLYDYDRTDKNGNKRELHIEKGLNVVNLNASTEPRQPMRVLRYKRGFASEILCNCRYFRVERMLLNTENTKEMAELKTDKMSFEVLLCIKGCGVMIFEERNISFFKGDCIFIPAESTEIKLHGAGHFIRVRC